ncbi:MAG: hypothetical protein NT130_03525 [Candidatus Micrarchaeota archaeon]|nr:hypothetical protein [Candidatus Micrarchaeota archaeon]
MKQFHAGKERRFLEGGSAISSPPTRGVLPCTLPLPSNEKTAAQDRDTRHCSICKRLSSGVRYSRIPFICDDCFGRLGAEIVGEINKIWG